jgi:hypothetical protein
MKKRGKKAPSNSVGATGAGSALSGGGRPSTWKPKPVAKNAKTPIRRDHDAVSPKKAKPKRPIKKSRQNTRKAF